jgi:dTDP-4-dehydrorhamnose reductase
MTVWIVGAGGFIGKHLVEYLREKNVDFFTTSRNGDNADGKLDLLDHLTFMNLPITESDFVILLAGISSPDVCQEDYETAYTINVLGTSRFINYCLDRGSKILFASSDTVYGNQENPIDENEPCVPHGNYGEMKHIIEKTFLDNPNFMAFRLSYILADNDKFTTYLHGRSRDGEMSEIVAYSDFYRNPIRIEDVLDGLLKACNNWQLLPSPKIINFCGSDSLSRFELALQIKERLGLGVSIRASKAPEDFLLARPRIISQSNERLRGLLGLES